MANKVIENEDGSFAIIFDPPVMIDIDGVSVKCLSAGDLTAEEVEDWL